MKTAAPAFRNPHLVSKLLCPPWHIAPTHGRAVLGALLHVLRGERPEQDAFGDPLPAMQIVGDVAIIPLSGVLMIDVPQWLKDYGLAVTDANDIAEELDRAVADPEVKLIVLDSDSPGGWSIAGNKLFEVVEAANRRKPVFGWCADGHVCASAAYGAVAPCTAILSGRHAMAIGSIGTYRTILDDTEAWKAMGVSIEVIRSGEIKGMGEDGYSEAQRAFLQSEVDEFGARFRRSVARYRTEIAEEDMQGQWYGGEEAARRGFTHGTARDINAALARFRRML